MAETIDPTPAATPEPTVAPATEPATTPETPENLTHAQLAELAALTGDAPPEAIEEPEPVVEPEAAPEEISESVQTSEDDAESVPTSPEPEVVEPEPVVETPATPAPTKPTKQEPEPADVQQQAADEAAARVARLKEINAEMAGIKAKIAKKDGSYDPFVDGETFAILQIEKDDLRDAEMEQLRATTHRAQQREEQDAYWSKVDTSIPYMPKGKARALWDEFYNAALASEPTADGAYSVAKFQLNERVKLFKARAEADAKKKPAPAPTPAAKAPTAPPRKAPVTTPGQVIPTGAGVPHRPPQPQPKTQDEMIARLAQMAGDPHDHFNR